MTAGTSYVHFTCIIRRGFSKRDDIEALVDVSVFISTVQGYVTNSLRLIDHI